MTHAKGYGLVRAEVDILDRLPPVRARHLPSLENFDALIRFSNGSLRAGADALLGGATGMALKMFGMCGPTLLEQATPHLDYTNIDAPIFFCSTMSIIYSSGAVPGGAAYFA